LRTLRATVKAAQDRCWEKGEDRNQSLTVIPTMEVVVVVVVVVEAVWEKAKLQGAKCQVVVAEVEGEPVWEKA